MATNNQKLGELGEILVTQNCSCPKCKRSGTLKRLPANFKCADIVCDFCGYLTQVKAKSVDKLDQLPKLIPGAAWGVQKERMDAGIYFPLYIVLVKDRKNFNIYYLAADLQTTNMFVPRKPLSSKAKRADWQGFNYDLSAVITGSIIKLVSTLEN